VSTLKSRIAEVEGSTKKALGTDYRAVAALRQKVAELATKAEGVNPDLRTNVQDLQKEVEHFKQEITRLETSVNTTPRGAPSSRGNSLEGATQEFTSRVRDLEGRIDRATREFPKLQTAIGTLEMRLDQTDATVVRLDQMQRRQEERTNQKYDNLHHKVDAVEDRTRRVEDSAKETAAETKTVGSRIQTIIDQLKSKASKEDVEGSVAAIGRKVEDINTRTMSLKGAVDTMGGEVRSVSSRVHDFVAKFEGLSRSYNTMDSGMQNLMHRVAKVEQKGDAGAAVAERMDGLHARVLSVDDLARTTHQRTADLQRDMHRLSGQVTSVSVKTDTLGSSVRNMEEDIREVDSRAIYVREKCKELAEVLGKIFGTRSSYR